MKPNRAASPLKRQRRRRHVVQTVWAALTNAWVVGFASGQLYTGPLKRLCVPGLNCYSCPGALGSCPIGALQAVLGSRQYQMAFYVVGFLMMVGALCGRFVCGWLCPFGWIQELLHKIPFPKKIRTFRGDRLLRGLKYVILAVLVVLLPLFAVDVVGTGQPTFCKYLCPAGTLEGGVPLVLLQEGLRNVVGWLYAWKMAILIGVILLSILLYRPFCKYLCPLGAIYALFNRVSLVRYKIDEAACTECGACAKVCPMQVDVRRNPNGAECIRCGACRTACSAGAIGTLLPRPGRKSSAAEQ